MLVLSRLSNALQHNLSYYVVYFVGFPSEKYCSLYYISDAFICVLAVTILKLYINVNKNIEKFCLFKDERHQI